MLRQVRARGLGHAEAGDVKVCVLEAGVFHSVADGVGGVGGAAFGNEEGLGSGCGGG